MTVQTVAPNEVPYGSVAEPILDAAGEGTRWYATADPGNYASEDRMLSDKMPTLVKGAGYCKEGGNAPLTDDRDIFRRSMRAEAAFRKSMLNSKTDPMRVMKGISGDFAPQLRAAAAAASPMNQQLQNVFAQLSSQVSDAVGKSITLTAPLTTGFVPYDLVAPSSLIYPVYSPLRNKLPRVPGQGKQRQRKIITGISGSQTGPSGGKFVRLAIPELVQSGGSISGASGSVNWPLNLPGTGTQDAVDLTVPYRFWGLSENLSWLN